jgi:hypothetical protein
MEILNITLVYSRDKLKAWYYEDGNNGDISSRPFSYENYLQDLEDFAELSIKTTTEKIVLVLLYEQFIYRKFDKEQGDLVDIYIDEIFIKYNRKKTSDLNIRKLNNLKKVLKKALKFLKTRMKEDIYNNETDSKLQVNSNSKIVLENCTKIVKEHLSYKEEQINLKLKKYNLD